MCSMRAKLTPPEAVIRQFAKWQTPIRGKSNPEDMTNDVWSWLIETRAPPHAAHQVAGQGERPFPAWNFCRMGQSETELPDGRIIYIGGEHEDSYDPDFYIYNDVVIGWPDGAIGVFGYPEDVFPPTDFHTATLIGDEIVIIGGLRYAKDRDETTTHVYRLRLSDLSMERVETHGDAPPWLFNHEAELRDGRIVCSGGEATHSATGRITENLTRWGFDPSTGAWEALFTRACQRWLLMREDESPNDLFGIGLVASDGRFGRVSKTAGRYRDEFAERGHVVDAELYASRFTPPFAHSTVEPDPDQDAFNTHFIEVEGVIVRIKEDWDEIVVTVEGQLDPSTVETLQEFGRQMYSALEGVPYKSVPLSPPAMFDRGELCAWSDDQRRNF